jgi:Ca2+-binding EF-hand superfamily protein
LSLVPCALAALVAAVLLVPAQSAPPADQGTRDKGQGTDEQPLVYLGDTRPILVRLHVLIDGKPYPNAWDAWMQKMFEYLDVDGDGSLSPKEAGRVPTVNVLKTHYQNAIGIFSGGGSVAPFAELDADKDGKVSLDELKAYYRKGGLGSFQLRGASGQGHSGALTEALFKHLDTNKDGKLSREELAAADELLHRLDLDEDEMISEDELVPDVNPYRQIFFRSGDSNEPASTAFQVLGAGEPPARVAKAVLDRYDKDKNGKLSRAESGFDEATFARLDANKDGQLDTGELEKWVAGASDLELTVRLGGLPPRRQAGGLLNAVVSAGRGPGGDSAVEVVPGKDWPLAAAARPQGDGVTLTHGVGQIVVRGDNNRFFGDGARGFYMQQFKQRLKDGKDYLTKAEVENTDFLAGLFQFADRDGDGKLTEKELGAFFDAIAGGSSSSVTLTVADHGAGLFELIDANRDGRLSIRELRTAWERVAPWDKTGSGAVTREQIPRQYQLTVRQGPPNDFGPRRIVRGPGMNAPRRDPGRGPLWFRKMDRNGDGDVSRREWLGSMEDFKKIDTDGDGLISVEEAEKADVWYRERMKEKEKK